jgi:hypothetical protein
MPRLAFPIWKPTLTKCNISLEDNANNLCCSSFLDGIKLLQVWFMQSYSLGEYFCQLFLVVGWIVSFLPRTKYGSSRLLGCGTSWSAAGRAAAWSAVGTVPVTGLCVAWSRLL